MNREFKDALEDSPVIAAIKDDNGLKECLKSDIQVVFILYGDICNIADIAFICHRFHGLREYSEACEGGKTGCH